MITSGNIALRKPVLSFSGLKESKTDVLRLKQVLPGPDFSIYRLQIEIHGPEKKHFCVFIPVNNSRDCEETSMLLIL